MRVDPRRSCHELDAGHRPVLVVTTEGLPRLACVLGTGEPEASATCLESAAHSLDHDPEHPSRLPLHTLRLAEAGPDRR